ncbi:glycosyltransferase family 39 protein [Rathayibacter sp. VKM Ac-2929]|uniref:glycosyltransferase family 39 protein n=1 Tax=Rathayibacter sp. VKM Ac-2929 TaxID=2929480 RepID=UPI001FB2A279|nr:glycosyltransferase family 39 protein [Rathayibacter sp. VKM Ac-2929]MCJ1672744.1 glycosyltransferase family 39 protein [Rathayibacter sp. VKM Ac-2929]
MTTEDAPAPGRGTRTLRRLGAHSAGLVFWILAAVGLALRVLFIVSPAHTFDADHAVVYLMAKHVADGELPAFFWGQSYGGTLLQTTAGLAMLAFGAHIEVLAIVSSLWFLGAAVLLRVIARRLAGPVAGATAGLLFWFPGVVLLQVSTRDPGFYGPSIVVALGVIAVATASLRRPLLSWIAAGALSGLALWTSPMSVALAAPAVLALVIRDIRRPLHWLLGIGTAVVAGSPWLLEALRSSSATAPLGAGTSDWEPTIDSVTALFHDMLPVAFTVAPGEPADSIVGWTAVVLLAGLVLVGAVRRRLAPVLVGTGTLLLCAVLILGAGLDLDYDSVRYSVFLMPAFALAGAWLLARWRPVALVAVLVAAALTVSGVWDRSEGFRSDTSNRFDGGYRAVVELLERRGAEHVWGDYWLSYAMTASTNEEVTVAALVTRRYPGYDALAQADGPPVIVVTTGDYNDQELRTSTLLPPHERIVRGGYTVYFYDEPFAVTSQPWSLY